MHAVDRTGRSSCDFTLRNLKSLIVLYAFFNDDTQINE